MLKRLLVPLDGSALAEAVLPVAAQVTRALQGTLILFRVAEVPLSDVPLNVIEAEEERAHRYLARIALRPELTGLQVETKTLCGTAARNILDAVQEYQADLVVMSSHGRSGFTRWTLGSVAEHVIHHVSVPVLVLHQPHEGAFSRRASSVALVALDGSALAEAALLPAAEVLAALSAPHEGTLHLVRIVAPPVEIRSAASPAQGAPLLERADQALREAESYLLKRTEQIQAEGLAGYHPTVTWSLHVSEDVRTSLIQAFQQADQEKSEALFLALATHRHRGHSGSMAVGLLEHGTLPLLIVHAKEDQSGL